MILILIHIHIQIQISIQIVKMEAFCAERLQLSCHLFLIFSPQVEVLILYLNDERCIFDFFIVHAFYFYFGKTGNFFGKFHFSK